MYTVESEKIDIAIIFCMQQEVCIYKEEIIKIVFYEQVNGKEMHICICVTILRLNILIASGRCMNVLKHSVISVLHHLDMAYIGFSFCIPVFQTKILC